MKKKIVLLVLIVIGYSIQAQAGLTTIGTATYYDGAGHSADYNLIWDDDNNGNSVVWLDYTRGPANWIDMNAWSSELNGEGVLTYNIDPGYEVTWNGDWRFDERQLEFRYNDNYNSRFYKRSIDYPGK